MPAHCEFVYEVQTEVRVLFAGLRSTDSQYTLRYQLKNVYTGAYEAPHEMKLKEEEGRAAVSWGFESMSTAEHFLYREMFFTLLDSEGREEGRWTVSFGREMDEACYANPQETPFRERTLHEEA